MNFKQRALALVLTTSLTVSLFGFSANASTQTFADVTPDHWAYSAIEEMVAKGYLNGMPDGTFAPNSPVTVAEFCSMYAKAFEGSSLSNLLANNTYSTWYQAYVDVIFGRYTVNLPSADPTAYITRSGVGTTVSWSATNNLGIPGLERDESDAIKDTFNDGDTIDGAAILVKWGIMSGTSETTFNGDGTLTRAEAAMILKRLCDTNILLEDPLDGTPEESWLAPGQYDTRVYTVPADLDKDGFVTEEEVYERLEQCKELFPDGSYTSSCGAFLNDLLPEVWGNLPGRTVDQSDLTNIRVGDTWWGPSGAYQNGVWEDATHVAMFSAVVWDGYEDKFGDGELVAVGDYYRWTQGSARNDSSSSNKVMWDSNNKTNRWFMYETNDYLGLSGSVVTTYYPA